MIAECSRVAGEVGRKGYMIEMSQSIRTENGHPTPGKLAELSDQHALGSSWHESLSVADHQKAL